MCSPTLLSISVQANFSVDACHVSRFEQAILIIKMDKLYTLFPKREGVGIQEEKH